MAGDLAIQQPGSPRFEFSPGMMLHSKAGGGGERKSRKSPCCPDMAHLFLQAGLACRDLRPDTLATSLSGNAS